MAKRKEKVFPKEIVVDNNLFLHLGLSTLNK